MNIFLQSRSNSVSCAVNASPPVLLHQLIEIQLKPLFLPITFNTSNLTLFPPILFCYFYDLSVATTCTQRFSLPRDVSGLDIYGVDLLNWEN